MAMRAGEGVLRVFEQPLFLATGGVIGIFGSLAGIQLVLVVLFSMMVIDIAVGLAVAWQKNEVSSKKSFQGGVRKFTIICVVLASWLIQYAIAVFAAVQLSSYLPDVPINVPLGEFVGSYFILYTFISILENAVRSGIRLPLQLTKILKIASDVQTDVKKDRQP